MTRICVTMAAVLLAVAWAGSAATGRDSVGGLRERGYTAAYNLDYDQAVSLFEQALRLDPQDTASYRGIATVAWLNITARRGIVCVDEFLDSTTTRDVTLAPPPSDLAARFHRHADRALELSEARLRQRPRDPEALYQYGASVGLLASYTATVDGRVLGAFRSARRAYNAHERVLELDPRRKDAGLVVGTYRYFVSTLSTPRRWMAYVAGFGGGRDEGLRLIEEAARYPGESQPEAKLALVLLYNKEQRYADADRVLADLQRRLPRNRLLWLEAGATALRGGALDRAETMLSEGLARAAADTRERAFGEEALWQYKLGTLRLAQRRRAEAGEHFRAAIGQEARTWVQARAHLGLGRLADVAGDRERARGEYRRAIELADRSRDASTRHQAQQHLRQPFRQG